MEQDVLNRKWGGRKSWGNTGSDRRHHGPFLKNHMKSYDCSSSNFWKHKHIHTF